MLTIFGNKKYEVTFWKKLQGYGLRVTDFDNYKPNTSHRVFSEWKNELLVKKLIMPLKSKGKQRYFTITPLGICHLGSLVKTIDAHNAKYMIRFLSYYSDENLIGTWEKICEIIGKDTACNLLKGVCDSIEIKETDNDVLVLVRYKTKRGMIYEVDTYKISNGCLRVQLRGYTFDLDSQNNVIPTREPQIDEEVFHLELADFVLKAFCYSVVENYHAKILDYEHIISFNEFPEEEKLVYKKELTEQQDLLEKLPHNVHSIAAWLIERDILTRTQENIKLMKRISLSAF